MSEDQKTWSILFAGVGGQGVLLAAEITALAALKSGFDIKQTEVHGVSQRGGSVETHVRFGKQVWSPVVSPGSADLVVGMEKLEALRFSRFVHPRRGVIVTNDHAIIPGSVLNAAENYPHHADQFMREKGLRVISLPASVIARELGDGRMANVVMIGAISSMLPITHETWIETLKGRIPERFLQGNLEAFFAGQEALAQLSA